VQSSGACRAAVPMIEPLESRALLTAVTFTLNPTLSSLTLSGTAASIALTEQAAGSLTAAYSGAIVADVTGDFITFNGGSTITAQTSGDWQPGGTPADYGASVQGTAATLALRDLALDVTSSSPVALSGGGFSSSGETI